MNAAVKRRIERSTGPSLKVRCGATSPDLLSRRNWLHPAEVRTSWANLVGAVGQILEDLLHWYFTEAGATTNTL
jgi:hypothetical protein